MLADKMKLWRELTEELVQVSQPFKNQIAVLEKEISDEVLELKQTQNVGDIRATYNQGRKTYDYKTAVESRDVPGTILERYKEISFDYKGICERLKIKAAYKQSNPSVTIKVMKK